MNSVHFSHNTCEWETPIDLFRKLDAEFHFTVDVAASDANRKCDKFFTVSDDGLAQSWDGETVWCNPPYGREIAKWIKKASESKCLSVFLIPARTDTKWFHDYCLGKAEIRFLKGRLKFGGADNAAPFPSMIVVFNNTEED